MDQELETAADRRSGPIALPVHIGHEFYLRRHKKAELQVSSAK
jgi:hypothetical protein